MKNAMRIEDITLEGVCGDYDAACRLARELPVRVAAVRVRLEPMAAQLSTWERELAEPTGKVTYDEIVARINELSPKVHEARGQLRVLEAQAAVAVERAKKLKIASAEPKLGKRVFEALHKPAVQRIRLALRELQSAEEEERKVREGLSDAFSDPSDPISTHRVTRHITPLNTSLAGDPSDSCSRLANFEKEMRAHGYLD